MLKKRPTRSKISGKEIHAARKQKRDKAARQRSIYKARIEYCEKMGIPPVDLPPSTKFNIRTRPANDLKGEDPNAPEFNAPQNQAQRIFQLFGGVRRLAQVLKEIGKPRDYSTLYRWGYKPAKSGGGRGGLIPTQAWPDIIEAARADGIILLAEHFDPRDF